MHPDYAAWAMVQTADVVLDPGDVAAALLSRPAWHAEADCRDWPALPWVPGSWARPPVTLDIMRQVCAGCWVRADCLEAADREGDQHGVRGGLTPAERRERRRRMVA